LIGRHDTIVDTDKAPINLWPGDIMTSVLDDDDLSTEEKIYTVRPFVTALMIASSGAVSIMPDYVGYGKSKTTHDRAFFFNIHYRTCKPQLFVMQQRKRFVSFRSIDFTNWSML
jgi:hypothetical protein